MRMASIEGEHNKVKNKMDGTTPYNVLAYLKKIPSLLSVYDALCKSPELRSSLIYALSNLEEFAKNDEIAKAS